MLTALSTWWFDQIRHLAPNHLVSSDPTDFPVGAWAPRARALGAGEAVTEPVRLECVARGYLFGSAWSDYQRTGSVQGDTLPAGLR